MVNWTSLCFGRLRSFYAVRRSVWEESCGVLDLTVRLVHPQTVWSFDNQNQPEEKLLQCDRYYDPHLETNHSHRCNSLWATSRNKFWGKTLVLLHTSVTHTNQNDGGETIRWMTVMTCLYIAALRFITRSSHSLTSDSLTQLSHIVTWNKRTQREDVWRHLELWAIITVVSLTLWLLICVTKPHINLIYSMKWHTVSCHTVRIWSSFELLNTLKRDLLMFSMKRRNDYSKNNSWLLV